MPQGKSLASLVCVNILNWNGWQDTLECLESVRRLEYPSYLTVVVDNGSTNGSADKIKAWAEENLGPGHVLADYTRETALAGGIPETEQTLDRASSPARMVLIRNRENLGFTGGHNFGIQYALSRRERAEHFMLLNNDATVEPQCLTQLVSVGGKSGAGIVGAIVTGRDNQPYFTGSRSFMFHMFRSLIARRDDHAGAEFWDSPIAYGAAMLVRRDVLEAIHRRRGEYLNEGLFAYCDEIELCWIAHQEGFRTVIANGAVARHDSRKRLLSPPDRRYFFYYSTRNRVHLAKDLLPLATRLAFHAAYVPLCARRIIKRTFAGQPELGRAIASGLFDGYRGIKGKWQGHDKKPSPGYGT